YRLGPRDYHLTLLLEFQDDRVGEGAEVPFRYQLAGAHGLPIEGMWYTSTYRDAVIGMLDANGRNLVRTKEESMRVSVKLGGDAVPSPISGPHPDSVLYAGVQTQYFASVVVVDDKQPSASKGGIDPKLIVRWARPTKESAETKGILDFVKDGELTIK